jgi:release factor glutamine methyltransferase
MKQSLKYIHETLAGLYDQREIDSFYFLIINHLLGYSKSEMILNPDRILSISDAEKVKAITLRLAHFEPIQYILGRTEFYGLPFDVEPGILIPRFETEELVDLIIKKSASKNNLKVLDMGCGSGCISISLKKNLASAEVWCCDISDKAIEVTARNAKLNNVDINIEKYDLLGLEPFKEDGFNIIVSNPPYVTCREKELMSKNVLEHEPGLALFVTDDDPLLFYREIVYKSLDLLLPQGEIYFEINESFGAEVKRLLEDNGFTAEIIADINGKDRIAIGYRAREKRKAFR